MGVRVRVRRKEVRDKMIQTRPLPTRDARVHRMDDDEDGERGRKTCAGNQGDMAIVRADVQRGAERAGRR